MRRGLPAGWVLFSVILSATLLPSGATAQAEKRPTHRFHIGLPHVVLAQVPFSLSISARNERGEVDAGFTDYVTLTGLARRTAGGLTPIGEVGPFTYGRFELDQLVVEEAGKVRVAVWGPTGEGVAFLQVTPGALSLLPPLLAIVLALVVREVILALFAGVWLGVSFLHGYNPLTGLLRALDTYTVGALADADHATVVLFSLTLGGMVGVISRSGGTQGVVAALSRWAQRPRGGQIATWAIGVLIFFDDYANTLIVGNSMRPLSDRLKISREKLSFIVDATAAPVTSVALVSSWVGFQVGLVEQAFESIGLEQDAYLGFLKSIPYASYSLLMLVFVLAVGWSLRDFSTMLSAERRSVGEGKVLADNAQPLVDDKAIDLKAHPGTPLRWFNAAIPIFVVIGVTLGGLYIDGWKAAVAKYGAVEASSKTLGVIIGEANSFHVLMWGAFAGAAAAIGLAVAQRLLTLKASLEAWLSGVKAMVIAMIILVLAWAIGDVCSQLNTAAYVISMTRGLLSPHFLPVLTFIVAAFISFSTGTSWATMAILTPIVIPMAHDMTTGAQLSAGVYEAVLFGTLGAVLSGAVFGDHCSPISDTTIMSSMTSASDHIDHVRTQLPYALTVGVVASLVGYLPAGFGFPAWLSLIAGAIILVAVLLVVGRPVPGRETIVLD